MKTGALLIARLSSTRLPAKNLKLMAGLPMIAHLAERVGRADSIDQVIITTSEEASDDPLAAFAEDAGIACHRGPLDDVMARICGAADEFKLDTVVEILGDNPLIDHHLVDDVMALYDPEKVDYAANISPDYAVRPADSVLFAIGVRIQAYSSAIAKRYVEFPNVTGHPSSYIFDNPDQFKCTYLHAVDEWAFLNKPQINFAVNYPKNFTLMERVFEELYPTEPAFSLRRAIEVMDADPSLYDLTGAE